MKRAEIPTEAHSHSVHCLGASELMLAIWGHAVLIKRYFFFVYIVRTHASPARLLYIFGYNSILLYFDDQTIPF